MLRILMLVSLLLAALSAQAEAENFNRIDFQVEATRLVTNDLMSATLSVTVQAPQPAQVAQQLNTQLNAALQRIAQYNTVKASRSNQNSYPIYGKNNRIEAWRGVAEVRIESRDFKAAGELIMQLQNTMQLGDVQFSLADDSRAGIEASLMTEAIKNFQARADTVRQAMSAKAYKTVHLSISNNTPPTNYPMLMRGAAMADSTIPAPAFANGETRLSVQINASIEIQ